MQNYPCEVGSVFENHFGETYRVCGFHPCGRGFTVRIRRVLPYDNGMYLSCSWTQFKRGNKRQVK